MVDLLRRVATLERTLMALVQHLADQAGRDADQAGRDAERHERAIAERATATDIDRMERNMRDDMRIRIERIEELLEQLGALFRAHHEN